MRRAVRLLLLSVLLLCAAAPAGHAAETVAVPHGDVTVSPTAFEAGHAGQVIRLSLHLAAAAPGAELLVTVPARWVELPDSGIRALRTVDAGAGDDADRDGRTVRLTLDADRSATLSLVDGGIPAGTYRLGLRWRDADGSLHDTPDVEIGVAPAEREAGDERPPDATPFGPLVPVRVADDVTSDSVQQSETAVAADPSNRNRVLVAVNHNIVPAYMAAWLTDDGGGSWTRLRLPNETVTPAGYQSSATVCCDPTAAADDDGNLWVGALTCVAGVPTDCSSNGSRVVVARVPAGGSAYTTPPGTPANGRATVGLPSLLGETADKPMMTIDDAPGSPRRGRLYVTWISFGSDQRVKVVVSACDTRPDPAHCDDPNAWSAPAVVSGASSGSLIYPDVATGPDGRVHVVWWNYSNANAIEATSCGPGSDCGSPGGWSAPVTVATLEDADPQHPGVRTPVPFNCPILAQPGGRSSPSPYIAADRSGGPQSGRVYVSWSDLRAGSGTTRCAPGAGGGPSSPPLASHLRWDVYVASAPGAPPATGQPSPAAGTRVVTDAEGGADSDEWFAGLAVDRSTGRAYASFYSTMLDPARLTTNYFLRAVGPQGGAGAALGPLTRLSAAPSDFSGAACCTLGNDYGDYTSLAASQGTLWPVWTDTSTGGGEAYTFLPEATLGLLSGAAAEGPGADHDGRIEPGEAFAVTPTVAVGGTVGLGAVRTTAIPGAGVAGLTTPVATGGGMPAGDVGPASAVTGVLDPRAPCGSTASVAIGVEGDRADGGGAVAPPAPVSVAIPVTCDPPPPPKPPVIRASTRTVRLSPTRRLRYVVGTFAEAVTGTASFRSATKVRTGRSRRARTVVLGRVAFRAAARRRTTVTLVLPRADAALVARLGRLRVRATVAARTAQGTSATRSFVFTLLPVRRRVRG